MRHAKLLVGILIWCVGGAWSVGSAQAQREDALEEMLEEGTRQTASDPREAHTILSAAYDVSPGYVSARAGSVALLLGHVLKQTTAGEEGVGVWEDGLRAQLDAYRRDVEEGGKPRSPVDPRLLDAYVEATVGEGRPFSAPLLSGAYLAMLGSAPALLPPLSREAMGRHVVISELLMGGGEAKMADRELPASSQLQVRAQAAARWWIQQDPDPSSEVNRRLVTHLQRVSYARKHLGEPGRALGFDDRGEVFIRYGEPSSRRSIDYGKGDFVQTIIRRGLNVRRGDFPTNEVWSYDRLDAAGVYVFVQDRNGRYALGTVNDLVPQRLQQRAGGSSPQAVDAQRALLEALRYVLGELSLHHAGFSGRYVQVVNDLEREEQRQIARQFRERGLDARRTGEAQRAGWEALRRNVDEDAYLAEYRSRRMPAQHAEHAVVTSGVSVLTVRMRDPGGARKHVLFWGLDREAVARACPPSATASGLRYRVQALTHHEFAVQARVLADTLVSLGQGYRTGEALGVTSLATPEGSALVGVYAERLGSGRSSGGGSPPPCSIVKWVPIGASEGEAEVEMSDLIPFRADDVVTGRVSILEGLEVEALDVIVDGRIPDGESAGVYFEVYGDDVDYVIEYEVHKRSRGGPFTRGRQDSSVYQVRRAAVDGVLRAVLMVDQSEWRGSTEVRIVVAVSRPDTGDRVGRELSLEINN